MSAELEDKLVFLNDPDRIIENAMKIRTYLETENQHNVAQMMQSLIRKASILNGTVTLEYTLPLPKNGTEESILIEKLKLDKKSCLSVGRTGISEQNFYRWKKKFQGMGVAEVRRLRVLEEENRKLRQLVADLSLDKQMLQDVLRKKP